MAKLIIKGMYLREEKGEFKKDDGSMFPWRRLTFLDMDTGREISIKADPALKVPVELYEKTTIVAEVDIKLGYGGKGTSIEALAVAKSDKI
jgi:hypothetical protein